MKISIIAACGTANQIGLNGKLPWHSKEDLTFFKNKTMGHHVVMGRVTFESAGVKLHGRKIIVLSKTMKQIKGVDVVVDSLEKAISYAKDAGESELFVTGGEVVYTEFLNFTDIIYLTRINYSGNGDRFFPEIDMSVWREIDNIAYSDGFFLKYKRKDK